MANLKTNYKNDILDTSKNVNRKYRMVDNGDGTYSFEDVTEYLQVGDTFGAGDLNNITGNLTASNGKSFRFGVTDDGEYGYIMPGEGGADTVIPFSNAKDLYDALQYSGLVTPDMTFDEMCEALKAVYRDKSDVLIDMSPDEISYTLSTQSVGSKTALVLSNGVLTAFLNMIGQSSSTICTQNAYSGFFDVTNYSKLIVSFYAMIQHAGTSTKSASTDVYIENEDASVKIPLFEHESEGKGDKGIVEKTLDDYTLNVEAWDGEYRFHIVNYSEAIDIKTQIKDVVLTNETVIDDIDDAVLITKTITANGTYKASDDNADGYSEITVNVPTGGGDAVLVEKYRNEIVDIISKSLTVYTNSDISYVGMYGFAGNFSMTDISLPNVESTHLYAFFSCSNLKNVDLPKLSTVMDYTFSNCPALEMLDFSEVTGRIKRYAFSNCANLRTLILRSETVVVLENSNAFGGTPIESGDGFVYINDIWYEQALTATNWVTIANQIKPLSELPEEV